MKRCLLTGIPFDHSFKELQTTKRTIKYEFAPVGVVEIGEATKNTLERTPSLEKHVLAGICRNAFENNEEPPLIDSEFLSSDFRRKFNVPSSKKEKARHLLKLLYRKGGSDLGRFQLNSTRDRTLTYSKDDKEFNDIVEYLDTQLLIKVGHTNKCLGGRVDYVDVQLTGLGIEEVEAELPKIPVIGLVVQEITTGDATVDENINHAKKLFLKAIVRRVKGQHARLYLTFWSLSEKG